MTPTTPDTRTAGQIALTPEALFELLKAHEVVTGCSGPLSDYNYYSKRLPKLCQAVIASLPRAGVRVLTVEELLRLEDMGSVWSGIKRGISLEDGEQLYLNLKRIISSRLGLLQSTPPAEPTKSEQDWAEFEPFTTLIQEGDVGETTAGGWCGYLETSRGRRNITKLRRPRQPQSPKDLEAKGGVGAQGSPLAHLSVMPKDMPKHESGERETPTTQTVDVIVYEICQQERDAALERAQKLEGYKMAYEDWMTHQSRVQTLLMNDKSLTSALAKNGLEAACDEIEALRAKLTASQAELAEMSERLEFFKKDRDDALAAWRSERAKADDLTAKLKAAEDGRNVSINNHQDALRRWANERDELCATVSRLEGELIDANRYLAREKQDYVRVLQRSNTLYNEIVSAFTPLFPEGDRGLDMDVIHVAIHHVADELFRARKELASMKSQPCGCLTEAVLSDALPKNHGLNTSQLSAMLIYLNHRLAPSWTPISNPPKSEDADRNGHVLWLWKKEASPTECGGYIHTRKWNDCPCQAGWWSHTNLPTQSVEDDGFEKWWRSLTEEGRKSFVREDCKEKWSAALASMKGAGK